jgi:TrmH family RNA methyltransferase
MEKLTCPRFSGRTTPNSQGRELDPIKSTSNTRVKRLTKLLRDAKARRQEGVWVTEGVRLAEEVIASGLEIESAYVVQDWAGERNLAFSAALAARGITPTILAKGVFREVSDTSQPQGVALIVKTPVYAQESVLGLAGPLVILDRIRDPGNLGTIARSAAAAGGAGLILTAETVDPGNPKALRASAGALLRLPYLRIDTPEAIRSLLSRPIYATAGHEGNAPERMPLQNPHALVLGHEAQGPDKRWKALVDGLITIPMERDVESLNVAVAASIILFESARIKRGAKR